jgi:hypothetical protein
MSTGQPAVIYRKGLDLKDAVAGALSADYDSSLVEAIKAAGYRHAAGRRRSTCPEFGLLRRRSRSTTPTRRERSPIGPST